MIRLVAYANAARGRTLSGPPKLAALFTAPVHARPALAACDLFEDLVRGEASPNAVPAHPGFAATLRSANTRLD